MSPFPEKPHIKAIDLIERMLSMPRKFRRKAWKRLNKTEGVTWKEYRGYEKDLLA